MTRAGTQSRDASDAARRAGVDIREVRDAAELQGVVDLLAEVWGLLRGDELVTAGLLRAMSHAGNYVVAAFEGERMVGACIGFLGTPIGTTLHSHISGVAPRARGRGIGTAIKLHQREWAFARGLSSITWTFDPLVARNAHLNIAVLGATAEEYLADFYGTMTDSVNAGQQTDRLFVRWGLGSPPLSSMGGRRVDVLVAEGDVPRIRPVDAQASVLRAQIPRDIGQLRLDDPENASLWRSALREVLTDALAQGWRITGFDRDRHYLLERP